MGTRLRGNGTGLNIDRTRFLVLTGMISAAAVACTIQQTKTNEAGGGPAAPPSDDGGPGADGAAGASADASDAADDGGEASASCLGDQGPDIDCTASKCPEACDAMKIRFKKAVAKEIVACLDMDPTCEGTMSCVDDHASGDPDSGVAVCDDPTAATFCQPLVDSCKTNDGEEITLESCVAMARTLTAAGRDQFTSCVTEGMAGYCTYGSSWCLDAMRY